MTLVRLLHIQNSKHTQLHGLQKITADFHTELKKKALITSCDNKAKQKSSFLTQLQTQQNELKLKTQKAQKSEKKFKV